MTHTHAERIERITRETLANAATIPILAGRVMETIPEKAQERMTAKLLPKLEAMNVDELASFDRLLFGEEAPLASRAAFPHDERGNCSWCGCIWTAVGPNDRTPYCDEACACHEVH